MASTSDTPIASGNPRPLPRAARDRSLTAAVLAGRGRRVTEPLLVSVEEACRMLGGIHRNTFDRVVLPPLRVTRIERRLLVPTRELERWVAEHSAVPVEVEADQW